MRREVSQKDLEKRYSANDMARIGCGGCEGCSDCCTGMGESAILDPLDVHRLCRGLGVTFAELMSRELLELRVADGVILPDLKMKGDAERCGFLNDAGRCAVHAIRPGVCRLFPLGRIYENGSFSYFVQSGECKKEPKSKVKIARWLDVPDVRRYERYVLEWHDFLEETETFLKEQDDERLSREFNVYLLRQMFETPYETEEFYGEFSERLEKIRRLKRVMAGHDGK